MGNHRSWKTRKRVKVNILWWILRIDLRIDMYIPICSSQCLNRQLKSQFALQMIFKTNFQLCLFTRYLHFDLVWHLFFSLPLYLSLSIYFCVSLIHFDYFFVRFGFVKLLFVRWKSTITFSCFFCFNFTISIISMFIQFNFSHSMIVMLASNDDEISVVTITMQRIPS